MWRVHYSKTSLVSITVVVGGGGGDGGGSVFAALINDNGGGINAVLVVDSCFLSYHCNVRKQIACSESHPCVLRPSPAMTLTHTHCSIP